MITELTKVPKIVLDGTWRLFSRNGVNKISNAHRLEAGEKSRVWTGESEQELKEFVAKLPVELTPSQRAAQEFEADAKANPALAGFQDLFRIISSLKSDADKATLIEAVAVPNELKPLQAKYAEILRA